MRFEWEQHKTGIGGAMGSTSGNGFMVYEVAGQGAHELHGDWGSGANRSAYPWKAVKQLNMRPDPETLLDQTSRLRTGFGDDDETTGAATIGGDADEDE
jgi:hypothetical protein